MMKLKVRLIPKCPKCGTQMRAVHVPLIHGSYWFYWCPDPQCRYAKEVNNKKEVRAMIEQLIDIAKLIIGVSIGTLIGSYIMEWRMKRIIKPYIPLIIAALGKKKECKGD